MLKKMYRFGKSYELQTVNDPVGLFFWSKSFSISPLNKKKKKFIRNQIIIYGIDQYEPEKIDRWDENKVIHKERRRESFCKSFYCNWRMECFKFQISVQDITPPMSAYDERFLLVKYVKFILMQLDKFIRNISFFKKGWFSIRFRFNLHVLN